MNVQCELRLGWWKPNPNTYVAAGVPPAAAVRSAFQVPKEFNVWSMDALSPDISNYIIGLNNPQPQPTALQQRTPPPAAS